MTPAVNQIELLRAQFRAISDPNSEQITDPDQAKAIIAALLQVGLGDAALRPRAAKTVAFWGEQFQGAAEMATAVLAEQEAIVAQRLQEIEQTVTAQAQQQVEIHQAIERAMLAAAVHKLQNNPRQQTIGELSKWQSEAAQLDREVAERREQVLNRLAGLGDEQ
jgi:hypothetical protein